MRLLVLDHFFAHDLEALREAAGPDVGFRVLPYEELRGEAMRIFPDEVATGIEAYTRPEHAAHRERYAARLEEILFEEFAAWPFDAFVVPSDSFFYIRAAPEICAKLGVPFFCVQKETTISPNTMAAISGETGLYAPLIADHMTCCSERHKQFWVRTGADPDRLEVTGQPRFDLYRQPERWPARADDSPTVMFFSYMLDAYHPQATGEKPIWEDLHRATERGLWELARRGWRVRIKPHPQQEWAEMRNRLRRETEGFSDRVELVHGDVDARRLVVTSDVVVGFQTTALIESMAAGKPVVYTWWDPAAHDLSDRLIPLHTYGDALTVVDDASALTETIERVHAEGIAPEQERRRAEIVAAELGPIDGHASERALASVLRHAEAVARARPPAVSERRHRLARGVPPVGLFRRRARRGVVTLRRRVGAALGR